MDKTEILNQPVSNEQVIESIESSFHPDHLADLRNMVTSSGGTTAEGLLALERGGVRAAIIEAIIAAHQKSQALSAGSR